MALSTKWPVKLPSSKHALNRYFCACGLGISLHYIIQNEVAVEKGVVSRVCKGDPESTT
jgi:hypothetical protein